MVALSSVSHRSSALVAPRSTLAGGTGGGFAQALAVLAGDEDDSAPASPRRQDPADNGKPLPDPPTDSAAAPTLDPRLLWLPAGMLLTTPAIPTPSAPVPLAVAPPIVSPPGLFEQVAPSDAGTGAVALGDKTLPTKLVDMFEAAERLVQAGPVALAAPAPVQPQPSPSSAADAPLSAELAALGLDQSTRDDAKKIESPVAPVTMTTQVALQTMVQPTVETRHVPLDLRGDTGLQKMIDHIETLRDDADANDTHIRLVPDALGGVDVAVRRSGDAVHVHFTADTEATRALLTDAQPRLAELAEARGVRIAGASVDTHAGGGRQQPRQRAPAPTTNISVSTAIDATGGDARLA